MTHDFATHKRNPQRHAHPATSKSVNKTGKRSVKPVAVAAVITTLAVGALGFSHVVSAVSEDLNESIADSMARKDAERALKAQRALEKQKLADQQRLQRQIDRDKAKAERNAGYDFYEDLVGRPWPVPVASDAYMNNSIVLAPSVKEDTSTIPYLLQVALYRDESDALESQRKLLGLGYSGKVETVKAKAGGILYQITLGPFTGLEKATHVRDSLQGHNFFAQVYRDE